MGAAVPLADAWWCCRPKAAWLCFMRQKSELEGSVQGHRIQEFNKLSLKESAAMASWLPLLGLKYHHLVRAEMPKPPGLISLVSLIDIGPLGVQASALCQPSKLTSLPSISWCMTSFYSDLICCGLFVGFIVSMGYSWKYPENSLHTFCA